MANRKNIHRSATDAWIALQTQGGLEPNGRDSEFVAKLCEALDPRASDIATALADVSTDRLVQCFFQSLQPFTEMFREILDYYKRAGARQGRQQWNIAVDEQHLELSDFEDFIQLWNDVPGELDVPAVDRDDINVHRHAWEAFPPLCNQANEAARRDVLIGDPEIDAWLSRYRSGRLTPVPASIWAAQQDHGFKELAAIGIAAVEAILEHTSSRSELREMISWEDLSKRDPFSLSYLGFLDTDNWLGSMVAGLALTHSISDDQRDRIGRVLIERLADLPVRKVRAQVSFGDLQRFLSLPVWRKRHELYAVWVFTEILVAAVDHDVRLHHANGRIAFEFRETLLASIETARPNLDVFTEKKTALANPVGKGRTNNVQPEYSIWESGRSLSGTCVLVVEVKHYKRTANRSFTEVLTDYAAAHPDAKVVLVNYGPIGDIIERLPFTAKRRCSVFENLTPLSRAERQSFRRMVEDVLGEPHRAAMTIGGKARATTAIAVDVSLSMCPTLAVPRFRDILDELAVGPVAELIYPIDDRICDPIPAARAGNELVRLANRANELSGPVSQLLGTYDEIIVITDQDGLNDLKDFDGIAERLLDIDAFKVRVRRNATQAGPQTL